MWETALAFAIWGGYGSLLTAAHIDPALTAVARTLALGLMLTTASVAIARTRGPREITASIPWQSGALWLSGAVLLVDEVLYAVSAVNGPVAIIGLAYGCVPILVPLLSRLAGTDRGRAMQPRHWICLALAFAGNGMVFVELRAAQIHFTMAALVAFAAGLLFTVMPVCSARLQQQGLGTWAVLKGQGAVASILALPLLALLVLLGLVSLGAPGQSGLVARSLEIGAMNAVVFTLTPFYLWYRGIARAGVARTSICAFAEPLVATLFSLFVLRDAPATPLLVAGVLLVLGAIAVSARSGGE
ncbi:MAG: transporter permease [Acidobacteria bacterium]|nr:transporter permease [Acidobacteriota bacterium]